MADIPINPVTRRVEFTGNTGTGPFAFTFNVLAQADIAAYKNNTLLALTSDYTVSLNSNGTGSITLASALIATDELVIIGDLALSRTTDFVTAGDLLASSLNEQFDSNVVMSQQLDERFDRTIRSQPGDINKNLYLPLVSSRASQLLSFDSSGNITTTSLSNVPDIGTVNLTVSGVASFADGSASAPSITNIGDTNTGMYFGAADQINFSIGGSEVISVASTGTTISGLSISSGDILLTDNSATALEIKEGSNNYLTFITTNGSEKLSFGSTANPTFEVNGSFRQPLIAATTSFFSQTYSGATLSATNGAVNIESYSASKAGIVLNGSGDQITFTSPTLGFVGLVQVVGAITTNTSLNIASSTTVDGILDEDDMSSNSETKLATQQSIKAYVDAQVGTVDTLAEVLGNGNTTGSNNIIVTAGQSITVDTISETTAANGVVIDGVTLKDGGATVTADVSFGVNDKAIFGAGSDLSIYHDGLHSYIEDSGTGRLHFKSNSYIFYNAAGTERAIDFLENDEVRLYFDGDEKLATTTTGVDIIGTITSDGLTVDGDGTFSATNPTVDIKATNGNDASLILMETTGNDFGANGANGFRSRYDGGDNALYIQSGAETTIRNRIKVDRDTGDISFYEDTGTTAKFFWDASEENLGIGTSSPSAPLHLVGSALVGVNDFGAYDKDDANLLISNGNNGTSILLHDGSGAYHSSLVKYDTNVMSLGLNNSNDTNSILTSTALNITSTGVGIGTSSPEGVLDLGASSSGRSLTFAKYNNIFGSYSEGSLNLTSNYYGDTTANAYKTSSTATYGAAGIEISGTGGTSTSGLIQFFVDAAASKTADAAFVPSERMRIDSSGNLLVANTTGASADTGHIFAPTGVAFHVRDGGIPLVVDRLTNDGDLQLFRKDGSTVGSIGSNTTSGQSLLDLTATQNFRLLTNGSERMRIDSSGNVGIGTDSPATLGGGSKLTVNQAADGNIVFARGGGTRQVQLGTTSTTGYINADNASGGLAFHMNGSERMRIDSSGNLLLGKTVSDGGIAGFEARPAGLVFSTMSSGNTYFLHDTSVNKFYVNVNGGIYNYQSNNVNLSDQRMKKNIEALGSQWAALKQWNLKKFHYNSDSDSDVKKVGVIAQDVQSNYPDLVTDFQNTEDEIRLAVKEQQMMWIAIKALQEAQDKIETLETENKSIKARITALENA